MVLGRRHALRRVRAGRKPVPGTGWLLSRQERGLVDPRYAVPAWPGQAVYVQYHPGGPQAPTGAGAGGGPGGWYNMQNMPPPPPVYDANRPPMYDGDSASPAGATKVDPDQQGAVNRDDYAPPAGPPPGAGLR